MTEAMIRGQADNLVSTGLAKAGFRLIFPDDMGFFQRDAATGRLNATTAAFPSGFRALGDYVHGKGLLWGVYSDSGTRTCGPGAGMLGHEEDDAKTFASWGVECDPQLATPPLTTAKQVCSGCSQSPQGRQLRRARHGSAAPGSLQEDRRRAEEQRPQDRAEHVRVGPE